MKLYSKLSSLFALVLVLSCGDPYKDLTIDPAASHSAMRFKPVFDKELYRCIVDGKFLFKKFHLSGILLFKKMDDGAIRAVFQNEMGLSFFDFEWDAEQHFKVNRIIPQLDKPAVIKILQKDLQLLLMIGLATNTEKHYVNDGINYDRFELDKGYAFYISHQDTLYKIENAGKKKVTSIDVGAKSSLTSLPSSIVFRHHKANFTIHLTKIEHDADE